MGVDLLQKRIEARASTDEAKLGVLGYKQELTRQLSWFNNFCVSISYLSPITGLTGTYAFLVTYGGPVTIVWGWIIVCSFNLLIGLALAEICSAYPTSGGVYFWSHRLGGRHRALASWITGWFNLLGKLGSTAGVAYTSAQLILNMVQITTGYLMDERALLGMYAAVLVLVGLLNSVAVRGLAIAGHVSVWWHVIFGILFVVALPLVAPTRQTAEFVFTSFWTKYDTGITNPGFQFLVGLLGCQWAMVGYDTAAAMTEETQGADMAGPISLVMTVVATFLMGFSYLMSVTFSIQDPDNILSPDNAASGGNPVLLTCYEAFNNRFGSGMGGIVLMVIPLVCSILCGTACVTSASRMLYCFSRDGAVPLSSWWRKVHPGLKAPVNAVWCSVVLCFIMGVPMLGNTVAFNAITSIGVVGLYISYGVPLFYRLTWGFKSFEKGPFHLGRWSLLVASVAFAWIAFACVLFILPYVYPVTTMNLNYAPVAVGVVLGISLGWWLLGAHKWFSGPKRNTDDICEEDITPRLPDKQSDAQGVYQGKA